MLLALKQLVCLHKPLYTIQELKEKFGFTPMDDGNCSYWTNCTHCGKLLKISFERRDCIMVQPPVLDYQAIHDVRASVHPAFGALNLPFKTYRELVTNGMYVGKSTPKQY